MIPKSLIESAEYLQARNLTLPKNNSDGRINSANSEDLIIESLQKANKWQIEKPQARHWYDVKIDNFFVNVKVTTTLTYDNTNAKPAIFYLLT